ncbi:MAG: hypothetical protein ACOX2A_06845 [Tepidanaerobacteraceae bacterium]|nr:hypothetical protein [Thermoanaerobacterales bacterium]
MKYLSLLESTGQMLTYKEKLQNLITSIKDLENQVDDNLQNALIKSSSIIKINKYIKEIGLMSETLKDLQHEDNSSVQKQLIKSLRRKIFESQTCLLEDTQKSMQKAVEAMSDTSNKMLLLAYFNRMVEALDKIDKKVEDG